MADALVSVRIVVNHRICLDWFVLELKDELKTLFLLYEELPERSRSENAPSQFRYLVPEKTSQTDEVLSLQCFVGKDCDGATVEVGGSLKCSSCSVQLGPFITCYKLAAAELCPRLLSPEGTLFR